MALLGNHSVLTKLPVRFTTSSLVSVEYAVRSNWNKSGRNRLRFLPSDTTAARPLYAIPVGTYPPYSWLIPQKAGGIASINMVTGAGSVTASNLAGGVNGSANLTGGGTITSAVGQLVISMMANLTGSGTVSFADFKAYLNAVANLTGSGSVTTAPIAALGWLSAATSGAGTVSNATPYATGALAATLTLYSSLTPEGIRDSVWNATLSNYPITGSAGKTLANAGSGGVDYNALADAVWNAIAATHNTPTTMGYVLNNVSGGSGATPAEVWGYATRTLTSTTPTAAANADAVWAKVLEAGYTGQDIIRFMAAVLAGKVSGAGTGTEVFRDLGDTKPRITSTVDSAGNRLAVVKDAT